MKYFDEEQNDDKMCLNLDLLEEKRKKKGLVEGDWIPTEGYVLLQLERAGEKIQSWRLGAQESRSKSKRSQPRRFCP